MDSSLSLSGVLASLESQIAHHREQEAAHAEQEALHREREAFHRGHREAHAAELAELTSRYESFKVAAEAAAELALRAAPGAARAEPPAPEPPADPAPGRRLSINAAVAAIVDAKRPDERFQARGLAEEVNRRYAERLGRPVDNRQVSVALRWLAGRRHIVLVERGNTHREAAYARAKV